MHPDKAEWKFYSLYVQPDMHVIDGGAGIGNMSFLLSFLAARVHAFEPHEESFSTLQQIFAIHPRGNVTLNKMALYSESGKKDLNVYDGRAGWSTLARRVPQAGGVDTWPSRTETVETVTVDEYCAKAGINRIGLLKLDVEGSEFPVLQGAEGLFGQGGIDCVVMEYGRTWWDGGFTPDDVEAFLSKHGFAAFNVLRDMPPFPGRESGEASRYAIVVAVPEKSSSRAKSIINFIAEVG